MARKVRVNAGYIDITLPDGNTYDGQIDVTLTDEQFEQIDDDLFPTVLTDLGRVESATLATGLNFIGYTNPGVGIDVAAGKFNIAGSGRITLSATGHLRCVLQNPSGSGKYVYVYRLSGFTTAVGYATLFINPSAGVPTTPARPSLNAIVGGGIAPVATLRADTSTITPMSGGVDTGIVIGFPPNIRTQIDTPPLILAPGVTLGINIPFAGAADATLSIYWVEKV